MQLPVYPAQQLLARISALGFFLKGEETRKKNSPDWRRKRHCRTRTAVHSTAKTPDRILAIARPRASKQYQVL